MIKFLKKIIVFFINNFFKKIIFILIILAINYDLKISFSILYVLKTKNLYVSLHNCIMALKLNTS